jgi:hypothetical protein
MTVPYIEAEKSKDESLHAFNIVNTKWVPENMVLGKPVISEATRMTTKYLLKHILPF